MPEFILEDSGTVDGTAFADLSPFVQGYIEALFFTEEAPGIGTEEWLTPEYQERQREGQADGSMPGDVGFGDRRADRREGVGRDFIRHGRQSGAGHVELRHVIAGGLDGGEHG